MVLINLIHHTDNYEKWITYVKDRPFNDKRYFITNNKIKALGWQQKIELLDGIKDIIYK